MRNSNPSLNTTPYFEGGKKDRVTGFPFTYALQRVRFFRGSLQATMSVSNFAGSIL